MIWIRPEDTVYSHHVLSKDLACCISPVKYLLLLQDDLSLVNILSYTWRHYNPIVAKMPQKIYFSFFSRNENFRKLSVHFKLQVGRPWTYLAKIWPAYLQIVFLKSCVWNFCFIIPFLNTIIFSKEVLIICLL